MKHILKIIPTAIILLVSAIAVAEKPAHDGSSFTDPEYNVIDDLSDYGGDYSWPGSDQATRPSTRHVVETRLEPVPQTKVRVDVDFMDSRFNTMDDLSDYGSDYRWPVADQDTGTDGGDFASVSKQEE